MKFHLSLFILLSIVACAPATEEVVEEATTTEADERAIQKSVADFETAFNAGEIETLLTIYTVDVIIMPPNQPSVTGRDALRRWFQDFFNQFEVKQFTTSQEEVSVTGDRAYSRGVFSWNLNPKEGGQPFQDTAKWIAIWQRGPDGSWKVSHDIWNSDNPAPGQ
ncbi:DUF4440 domain-containing protein [Acidobacteria bacterium AH-259-D05]|nr:DUF4440 domain-containing protein [Acidobacteria bacterium AH-259-D05]